MKAANRIRSIRHALAGTQAEDAARKGVALRSVVALVAIGQRCGWAHAQNRGRLLGGYLALAAKL